MIMRVGGRFPYLHQPETLSTAQGPGGGTFLCVSVCVFSLYLSMCVYTEGVEIFDRVVNAGSKHSDM